MATTPDPHALFALGQRLVANRRPDTPEFTQGLEHLTHAARSGLLEAQLTLGHVYAQLPALDDSARQCAHWYRLAAEQGDPVARDRLADLHLLGRGVEADDAAAFELLDQTAAQGYPHALCSLAYLHDTAIGTDFDPEAASDRYLLAAAQADPRGLFNLGLRYRDGFGAPRHPAWALACLSLAAFAGYPLAGKCARALQSTLPGRERQQATDHETSLRARLRAFQARMDQAPAMMDDAEARLQYARENFALLNDLALSLSASERRSAGEFVNAEPHRPDAPCTLNGTPYIFTLEEFVSESECAQLLAAGGQDMQSAATGVQDRLSGEQTAFTGKMAAFTATDYDVVMRCVERRIAECFDVPPNKVEPLSVLRYGAGNRYAAHVDYFDATRLDYNRSIGDHSGQRIASFLVYLRAPEQGGETSYMDLGIDVAGRPRMALCHWNLLDDGSPDPRTLHRGNPVARGEKWLARTTIREQALY